MTHFTDEQLMAFADGELDAATEAAISAAADADPLLAVRVAQHRAIRETVFAGFSAVLDEPIPVRLQRVANDVTPALRLIAPANPIPEKTLPSYALRSRSDWGARAAMLLVGLAVGGISAIALHRSDNGAADTAVATQDGRLIAQQQLARALSQQVSDTVAADTTTRIGVTFRTADGSWCRSFTLQPAAADGLAGLACRGNRAAGAAQWVIPVLVQNEGDHGAPGAYRQAGSATPATILREIDRRIVGVPLDAAAERLAVQRQWR